MPRMIATSCYSSIRVIDASPLLHVMPLRFLVPPGNVRGSSMTAGTTFESVLVIWITAT